MATGKPLWLRGVQTVDRIAAPMLESTVQHDGFILGLSLLQQTRRTIYRRTERASRRVLHGLNLPTASDVNRLLIQIAAVESRVRQLNSQLGDILPPGQDAVKPSQIEKAGSTPGSVAEASADRTARPAAKKTAGRPAAKKTAGRPAAKKSTAPRAAKQTPARPSRSNGSAR